MHLDLNIESWPTNFDENISQQVVDDDIPTKEKKKHQPFLLQHMIVYFKFIHIIMNELQLDYYDIDKELWKGRENKCTTNNTIATKIKAKVQQRNSDNNYNESPKIYDYGNT